jgi:hypothetical protein
VTLAHSSHTYALPVPPLTDDAAARRALRDQIARLDGELSELALSAWPATVPELDPAELRRAGRAPRGSAVQSLAELERTRDALAVRASQARHALDDQGARQEAARRAREELLQDPRAHRFARVTNAEVGEAGCRDWHVRPRFGPIGMLAGWWRVVISSGCPLPGRLAGAPGTFRS